MRTLSTAEMEQIAWAIQQQMDTGSDAAIQLAIAAVIEIQKLDARQSLANLNKTDTET